MQNANSNEPINAELEEEDLVQIPIETIKFAIDSIKSKLCSAVGEKGTIRFWLKAGAKAEIFGIGGSSESGIEVTVNCKK